MQISMENKVRDGCWTFCAVSEEVEADCGGKVDCQSVEVDKAAGVCKGTVTQ